jgi:hypothetical protein
MTTPESGPGRRQLDRAPGERYRGTLPGVAPEPPPAIPWSRRRRVGLAVTAAVVAGGVTLLLGGLDIGPGLLAIGAATGWLVGLLLAGGASPGRGPGAGLARGGGAAGLGGVAIAAGLLGDGVRALSQGGVLSPLDYAGERYGPLAILVVLAAALVGFLRGR